MILNIVHPNNYKLEENTLIVGPSERYSQRDRGVSEFVREVMDSGSRVIWHKLGGFDGYELGLNEMALKMDPIYEFLFDPQVETITTTNRGIPIMDVKPNRISMKDWESFAETFTSESEYAKRVEGSDWAVFIGGALEACLPNAAYSCEKSREVKGRTVYLPELCVSFDEKASRKAERLLKRKGIYPVSI